MDHSAVLDAARVMEEVLENAGEWREWGEGPGRTVHSLRHDTIHARPNSSSVFKPIAITG